METSNTNQELLSEEDLSLKTMLDLYVKSVQDNEDNPAVKEENLVKLIQEIRTAITSPMIGYINKFLQFLLPHYNALKAYYDQEFRQEDMISVKEPLAVVLSLLATKSTETEPRLCLKYKLLGSKEAEFTRWGDEYIRILAAQIKEEYAEKTDEIPGDSDFYVLVDQMIMFYREKNSVSEAIDLIIEFKDPTRNQLLNEFVIDKENYEKACSYLKALATGEQQKIILGNVHDIYLRYHDYERAFEDKQQIVNALSNCNKDLLLRKQYCFVLARHGISLRLQDYQGQGMELGDDEWEMQRIINNLMLSQGYLSLARYYDGMDPKSAKDIFKVNSEKEVLAETLVNGFLYAGFGKDNLIIGPYNSTPAGHQKISAVASSGLICLWDAENGNVKLDKYFEQKDSNVIAGALLGVGILNSSVKQDPNPALDRLKHYADNKDPSIRIGAIMGLGITYANTRDAEIRQKLMDILRDKNNSVDVIAFSAIALGLVCIASHDFFAQTAITEAISNLNKQEGLPFLGLLYLGNGLLYLRTTQHSDVLQGHESYLSVISCAYAGIRNQATEDALYTPCEEQQEVAVLGIAMVAMGDEMGLAKTIQYLMDLLENNKNQKIRKTVPLALSLLCISNPKRADVIQTLDTSSRDPNLEVAMSAIISLGLVGSGTKNPEIDAKLRDLSNYYSNNDSVLFCVQIAQGLVHLGKGLLTLNPYHSEGVLVSPVAIGGLMTFLYSCLDMNEMLLGKYHFVLYFLVLAMQPKMLITVDENLKPLSVPVRVGWNVNTVSNAGQIFTTPVVLCPGQKAILSTNKYVPLSHILEGFVILKNNPDYDEATDE